MWKITWRGLRGRLGRVIITVLSVAIGVGYLIGVLGLRDTISDAFAKVSANTQIDDLYVVGRKDPNNTQASIGFGEDPSREQLPETLAEKLRMLPEVASATADLENTSFVVTDGKGDNLSGNLSAPTLLIGIDPSLATNKKHLVAGRMPVLMPTVKDLGSTTHPAEIAVEKGALAQLHRSVGDRVQLINGEQKYWVRIVGKLDFGTSMVGAKVLLAGTDFVRQTLVEGAQKTAQNRLEIGFIEANKKLVKQLEQAKKELAQIQTASRAAPTDPKQQMALQVAQGKVAGLEKASAQLAAQKTTKLDQVKNQIAKETQLVSSISINLKPGINLAAGQKTLNKALSDNYKKWGLTAKPEVQNQSQRVAEQNQGIEKSLGIVNLFLLAFVAIAFFVGMFEMSNTFQMLIHNQRRHFALLRSLGFSPSRVFAMVIGQSLLIGVFGSACGVIVGYGFAYLLVVLMRMASLDLPQVLLSPTAISLGVLTGLLLTVLGALFPAWKATRISPLEALRESTGGTRKPLWRRGAIGLFILIIGAITLTLGSIGYGSHPGVWLAVGIAGLVLAILILNPLLVRPLAAVIAIPFLLFRPTGRLALRNIWRNPRRIGATSSAVVIGVSLVTLGTVLASSLATSVNQEIAEELRSDLLIVNQTGNGVPLSKVAKIAQLPGVRQVNNQVALYEVKSQLPETSTKTKTKLGEKHSAQTAIMTVFPRRTIKEDFILRPDLKNPTAAGNLKDFEAAPDTSLNIVVTGTYARKNHLKVGDELGLTFGERKLQAPIVALVKSGSLINQIGICTEQLKHEFGLSTEQELPVKPRFSGNVFINVSDGEGTASGLGTAFSKATGSAEHEAAVEKIQKEIQKIIGKDPLTMVLNQKQFKDVIAGQVKQMLAAVYALLALSIIIAIMGIVSTQTMAVYERQSELAMLRAIGYSRIRVIGLIICESILITLVGAVIGLGLGGVLSLAVYGYGKQTEIGIDQLTWPIGALVSVLFLALLIGVIAGALPGWRAARLRLLTAIANQD